MSYTEFTLPIEPDLDIQMNGNLANVEEELVADFRGMLSPAQQVERKLVAILNTRAHLVSHLQTAVRRR